MKIRNGFVSNSSSSSFMIVCQKETLNKVLKLYSPSFRKFASDFIGHPGKTKLFGHNYLMYCGGYTSEQLFENWEDKCTEGEDAEEIFDLWDGFLCDLAKEENTCVQVGD